MTRFRSPGLLDRIWLRRIRDTTTVGMSPEPLSERLARLVPYSLRWFHRRYAGRHWYFWLRCPLCGRPFGGHEAGRDVPNPVMGPGWYLSICSRCSRRRAE